MSYFFNFIIFSTSGNVDVPPITANSSTEDTTPLIQLGQSPPQNQVIASTTQATTSSTQLSATPNQTTISVIQVSNHPNTQLELPSVPSTSGFQEVQENTLDCATDGSDKTCHLDEEAQMDAIMTKVVQQNPNAVKIDLRKGLKTKKFRQMDEFEIGILGKKKIILFPSSPAQLICRLTVKFNYLY